MLRTPLQDDRHAQQGLHPPGITPGFWITLLKASETHTFWNRTLSPRTGVPGRASSHTPKLCLGKWLRTHKGFSLSRPTELPRNLLLPCTTPWGRAPPLPKRIRQPTKNESRPRPRRLLASRPFGCPAVSGSSFSPSVACPPLAWRICPCLHLARPGGPATEASAASELGLLPSAARQRLHALGPHWSPPRF